MNIGRFHRKMGFVESLLRHPVAWARGMSYPRKRTAARAAAAELGGARERLGGVARLGEHLDGGLPRQLPVEEAPRPRRAHRHGGQCGFVWSILALQSRPLLTERGEGNWLENPAHASRGSLGVQNT